MAVRACMGTDRRASLPRGEYIRYEFAVFSHLPKRGGGVFSRVWRASPRGGEVRRQSGDAPVSYHSLHSRATTSALRLRTPHFFIIYASLIRLLHRLFSATREKENTTTHLAASDIKPSVFVERMRVCI